MCPVLMGLCHDLPWNEGLFRPIEFILPEGSVVNPIRPAPVSSNVPSGGLTLVTASAQTAVAKMLLSSERHRDDAAAVVGATFNYPVFAGVGRDGRPFATLILDGLAGGAGARAAADGDSSGHSAWATKTMIANVETTELLYPLLYLWRREVTDSPGAGELRGGAGFSVGIKPWKVPGLACITVGVGTESRGSLGLAGGYPGSHAPVAVLRGAAVDRAFADGALPASADAVGGEREPISPKGMTLMSDQDVLDMYVSSGGGGFGDPLNRNPAAVRADVAERTVSGKMATAVYGVVLRHDGSVDEAATERRRAAMREERLHKGRAADGGGEMLTYDEPISAGEPVELAPAAGLFALRHRCRADTGELVEIEMVLEGTV
jgi:N-methylhydantoinase B